MLGCRCTNREHCRWYAPTRKNTVGMIPLEQRVLVCTDEVQIAVDKVTRRCNSRHGLHWWVGKIAVLCQAVSRLVMRHGAFHIPGALAASRHHAAAAAAAAVARVVSWLCLPGCSACKQVGNDRCNTPAVRGMARNHRPHIRT